MRFLNLRIPASSAGVLACAMGLWATDLHAQQPAPAMGASVAVVGLLCGYGPGAAIHRTGVSFGVKLWGARTPGCDSPVGGIDATAFFEGAPFQIGGGLAFSEAGAGAGIVGGLAVRRSWLRADALLRYLATTDGLVPIWSVELGFTP